MVQVDGTTTSFRHSSCSHCSCTFYYWLNGGPQGAQMYASREMVWVGERLQQCDFERQAQVLSCEGATWSGASGDPSLAWKAHQQDVYSLATRGASPTSILFSIRRSKPPIQEPQEEWSSGGWWWPQPGRVGRPHMGAQVSGQCFGRLASCPLGLHPHTDGWRGRSEHVHRPDDSKSQEQTWQDATICGILACCYVESGHGHA